MAKKFKLVFFLIITISLLNGFREITNNSESYTSIHYLEYLYLNNMEKSNPISASMSNNPNLISTEYCRRIYGPIANNDSNIYFAVPSQYQIGTFEINLQIHNSIKQIANLTPSNDSDVSRYEQAQSFHINSTSELANISVLFGPDKKDATLICELRNNTYDGDLLQAKSVTFSPGWNNISFGDHFILTQGKYFLYITASSQSQKVAWCKTPTNTTETWINNGGWISSAYDLSLRVYTTTEINPADIEMQIDSQDIISLGNGMGTHTITKSITGSNLILSITSNQTVFFTYSATAQFYRQTTIPYTFNWSISGFESNFSLGLANVDSLDLDYHANVTGFAAEYSNIRLFKQSDPVGFTKLNISTIQIASFAERIVFNCPNSILSVKNPSVVYSGEMIPINLTLLNPGTVKLSLKAQEIELYSELSTINQDDIIYFFIDPIFPSGELELTLEYMNSTHPGLWWSNITLLKESRISYETLKIEALSRINIACMYVDALSNNCIVGANIDYSVEDLSGTLNTNNNTGNMLCFYSNTLDLNLFALTPGIYNISLIAQKAGYRTIIASIPLEIVPRETEISISQNKISLEPNSNMTFSIVVHDKTANSNLLRPVDVKLTIYSGETLIATKWAYNVIQSNDLQWQADPSLAAGDYSVKTEIYNAYYSGAVEKPNAFTIMAPKETNYWGIVLLSLGAVCGFSMSIVKKKQNVRNSVGGLMVLDKDGTLMSHLISKDYAHGDPILISGAVTGIMTIIKEITGKGLHTIGVEGGYLNICKGKLCYVIVFMRQNPKWIKSTILETITEIERRYGPQIEKFDGKLFDMALDEIVLKFYGNNSNIAWDKNLTKKTIKTKLEEKSKYLTPSDIKQ